MVIKTVIYVINGWFWSVYISIYIDFQVCIFL